MPPDDVARVGAQGPHVLRIELKLRVLGETFDMMNFLVFSSAACRAIGVGLDVCVTRLFPSASPWGLTDVLRTREGSNQTAEETNHHTPRPFVLYQNWSMTFSLSSLSCVFGFKDFSFAVSLAIIVSLSLTRLGGCTGGS